MYIIGRNICIENDLSLILYIFIKVKNGYLSLVILIIFQH